MAAVFFVVEVNNMPSKAEFYRQMAEQVSTQLVGSWKEWTAFLATAARLYKYPFHEQMMIYGLGLYEGTSLRWK